MEVRRRKIGSALFKGMMALGAAHDLCKITCAVDELVNGWQTASSPDLLPEERTNCGETSFTGGAGISNIEHSRGHWMICDGQRMVEEGKRMKAKGSGTPYDSTAIIKGQELIRKGEALIKKGKALVNK